MAFFRVREGCLATAPIRSSAASLPESAAADEVRVTVFDRKPKKRGPFQRVPVIEVAISERLE